jgi:DNA-binding transcriptional ArsR family regulator
MLLTLLGGTPQSGSALAEAAGISRSLASAHLKKLVGGGLVRAQRRGRQQLYSIASEPALITGTVIPVDGGQSAGNKPPQMYRQGQPMTDPEAAAGR